MSEQSAIRWTDATWTVVTGCDVVSPACAFCYARQFAPRLQRMERARLDKLLAVNPHAPQPQLKYQTDSSRRSSGVGFEIVCHEHLLDWPQRLKRGRRIFVTSMGDLFHERVPDSFIARVFAVMEATPRHDFQVLTKRTERLRAFLETRARTIDGYQVPANVWLGATVENATWARRRIPDLVAVPAAVHFLSVEPLLADVADALDLSDIEWVIGGGESGQHLSTHPHRFLVNAHGRPRQDRLEWARALRDRCIADDVPFLWKQWGGRTPKAGGCNLDGRTWDQMPHRSPCSPQPTSEAA